MERGDHDGHQVLPGPGDADHADRTTTDRTSAGSAAWPAKVPHLRLHGAWLGAVLGLTVGVAVGLGAVGELLVTMHPPNLAGRGLAQGFGTIGLGAGPEAAVATLRVWQEFDDLGFSADLLSAFTIAKTWLVIDSAFLVLYAASVLALARPRGPLAGGGTANTLAATRLLVIALAAFDALENSVAFHAVSERSTSDALYSALNLIRVVKVFVLVLPLMALLVLLLLRKLRVLLGEARVRQALVMGRTQILVLLLISLALWYEPTSDVMLDIGTTQTVALLAFGGLLCAGLGVGARVLIDRDRVRHDVVSARPNDTNVGGEPGTSRGSPGAIVAFLIACLLAVLALSTGWRGLAGAALVIVSVLVASWVLKDSEPITAAVMSGRPTARLPALLGLAPVGLLGIALIHWTLWADLILTQPPMKAVTGLVIVALAGALVPPIGDAVEAAQTQLGEEYRPNRIAARVGALARRRGAYDFGTSARIAAVLGIPTVLLLLGPRFVDVRYAGPLSLVLGAGAALNLIGTGLVVAADWWRDEFGLPSVFTALRMRRIPVFLLLAFWMVVNAIVFPDPSYYDVTTEGTNRRVTLAEAYEQWKGANLRDGAAVVPLVVVAAEGGGLRAAYWTERVLSEIFAGARLQPFALSGTSGGSVGIATFLARHEPLGGADRPGGIGLTDVPDPDFLSALFQRWFTLDVAHSLLGQPRSVGDRAAALEDALTAEIPTLSTPYHYSPAREMFQPVTIFNATDLQDGCLAPISTLSDLAGPAVTEDDLGCLDPDRPAGDAPGPAGFPGAADIAHECPGRGMSFATAAVVSARSPYVTPAGRLENCNGGVFFLGDGGYVDNSGAVAAAVILQRIETLVATDNATGDTCIVPMLLQIDNGAETLIPGGQATGNPSQFTVVLTGALASTSARHDVAKVAAAALVQQPLVDAEGKTITVTRPSDGEIRPQPVERYFRIFPLAQAGRDASVGWLLSQPSKDALDTQLDAAIADALTVLSPDAELACS